MMEIGNKVKVSEDYHWAKNVIGTITQPPNYIVEMFDGWNGMVRDVEARKGKMFFYWIVFDESQTDIDGDGHYFSAEIDSAYLNLVT